MKSHVLNIIHRKPQNLIENEIERATRLEKIRSSPVLSSSDPGRIREPGPAPTVQTKSE